MKRVFSITEVTEIVGCDREEIASLISREWILPTDTAATLLDEEDVARIQLIRDLKRDFGANEESIPIILHLLDQLYFIQKQLQQLRTKS